MTHDGRRWRRYFLDGGNQWLFLRPTKRCARSQAQRLDGFSRVSASCDDSNRITTFNFKPEKCDNAFGVGCFPGRLNDLYDTFKVARCVR